MEFDNIGKKCNYCNQRDFLPIICLHCKKHFCKEHSFFENHNCTNIKKKEICKSSSIYIEKCNVKGCKKKEIIKFICKICNKNYCMLHRFADSHNCLKQEPNDNLKLKKQEPNNNLKFNNCFNNCNII
jgi:hypothetical protein